MSHKLTSNLILNHIHKTLICKRLLINQRLSRQFSSGNEDNSDGKLDFGSKLDKNSNKPDLKSTSKSEEKLDYIPNRIKRRLEQKGLSLEDVEISRGPKQIEDLLESQVAPENVKQVPIDFLSDLDAQRRFNRNQEKHSFRPPNVSPEDTSILMFPGQGSQFVGMGKKLLRYPGVEDIYNRASEILGYDLLNLCLNGPAEKLQETIYCQPAVVVTSLAAMEKLKEEHPNSLNHVVAVAGFSVGEITALAVTETVTFEEAIQIIKHRAAAMQKASEAAAGGLLTVICDHKTQLRVAMVAAKEYCRTELQMEDPECSIANFLCTDVKVVGGDEAALQFLEKYGAEWGIKRTKRLAVSGAFHTNMMRVTGKEGWKFREMLQTVNFKEPKYPLHLNLDGKRYPSAAGVPRTAI
ncbi:hypothetical protein DPMN_176531 [Dreissena polymorpha]|uniref:Malonyl-CoA:ACP transacylase (MAT) domain-containing protein n=1 Tax=Dreissena polymorpha TaxID=45954 RepID=A0A9D4E730_DREPO|nr:hypothetical protein DPMN_176531 [Dreissena polymorpha]